MKQHTKNFARRALSGILAALLVLTLLVMAPAPANRASAAKNATVSKYEDQISELEAQQKDLKNKIEAANSQAAQTAEHKQNLDYMVSILSQKIGVAQSLLDELETNIDATEESIAQKETAIDATFERFLDRMRMSQEEGTVSYLSMLLGAESISDFLTRMDRIGSMMEYDRSTMEQYRAEKEALEQERADLAASIELQKDTLDKMEADKKENERLAAQAASYYETLQANAAAYQQQYNAAAAASDKLDKELQAYLANLAKQGSSKVIASGDYVWPLPSAGTITCRFMAPDLIGVPHRGTDIAIAFGTPIYAVNDGTVVTAAAHSSYGNYVVLDHGNGISTLYAHCSGLAVSAGQTVTKGQVIGYVGSTGFSSGNHLHFEYRVNGQLANGMALYGR